MQMMRSWALKGVALVAMASIVACAPQPSRYDPDQQALAKAKTNNPSALTRLSDALDVDVRWRRALGKGPIASFSRLHPAVVDDAVFVADTQGEVFALDLDDGDERWSVSLDDQILGGATAYGQQVFVSTRAGELYALSQDDGHTLWHTRLSSESPAQVGADEQRVYVHTIDGRISALDRANGKLLWSYEASLPVLTVRGVGAPLVIDQRVVVGLPSGKVVALDRTLGAPVWEVRLAVPDGLSELERLIDVDGEVLRDDTDTLYAASYHGSLAAMTADGQVRWREESSTYTRPSLALGNLYLTLDDDAIQAYDQFSGTKVWQQKALRYRDVGRVITHKNWLLAADGEGFVHVLNQVDGQLVGRTRLRPKPLHMTYPHQGEAINWRPYRGIDFGIRAHMVSTKRGVLVYTNAGELVLLSIDA